MLLEPPIPANPDIAKLWAQASEAPIGLEVDTNDPRALQAAFIAFRLHHALPDLFTYMIQPGHLLILRRKDVADTTLSDLEL